MENKSVLPDPKETLGLYLITSISYWYENGYFWATQQKWDRVYIVDRNSSLESYRCYWKETGTPELLKLGTQTYGQTACCSCEDCKKGRKLVRKGWKPKIDEYGYPRD